MQRAWSVLPVATLLLAALVAPAVAQQAPEEESFEGLLAKEKARATREITFYGHVFGFNMNSTASTSHPGEFGPDGPQPANTIYPVGDANLGLGAFNWCGEGVSTAGGNNCDTNPVNKLALFLTAGPVQVHSREEFVYSKLHNERGRTKDVVLDTTQSIKASMWMSMDPFHAWSVGNSGDDTNCVAGLPPDVGCPYPYWGWDPGVVPQWVIEAKLYMVELGEYGQGASEPPPFFPAWQSNALTPIAGGATPPADIQNGIPGQPNVHEFVVDLGPPQVDVIPRTHDVLLVFNFYSFINGQKVSGHWWRVWAGELFPVKFTLPVKNALDVELVIPQFLHEKLLIHSVMGSAWGSYDVAVDSAKLTVLRGNTPVNVQTVSRVGDFQVAHGAHFKPVNITWIWDYKADNLAPGAYKVQVEACNQQRSACEMTEAAFTIDQDLRPIDIRVGRSGQQTASEQQLDDITSGFSAQSLAPAGSDAEGREAPPTLQPRTVPGPDVLLLGLAAVGALLVLRRRWGA